MFNLTGRSLIAWSVTISILSSAAWAKSAQSNSAIAKKALSPREIFRKTASQWSGDIFVLPKYGNTMLDGGEFDPKSWLPSTIGGRLLPPHPLAMHGIAWDYDLQVPVVFYDPKGSWFKPGKYQDIAVQQDIVPTLAAVLDIPAPAKNSGRILKEAMLSSKTKPKVILIFVQDQVGRHYFAAHPGKAPFYESLMKRGADFVNGTVAHVDVETSVGHASIGTGSWPSEHGVAGNNFFHSGFWRQLSSFTIQTGISSKSKQRNPSFFFAPTLSDVWSVARSNKPVVLSVAPVPRASIAMGGHGALFNGGTRTYVTWIDEFARDGRWITEEENYELPSAFKGKPVLPWLKQVVDSKNSWRGHQLIFDDQSIDGRLMLGSPGLVRQQGELTRAAIEELKIGHDDETDLIWFNTKSTDYCGHMFGYESEECGDVLAAADDEARRIMDLVEQKTNGNFLAVLTADHGAARLPEASGAYRIDRSKLKKELNDFFDHRQNNIDVVQVITTSQIYINVNELKANGHSIDDVVKYLKKYKAIMEWPYNVLADEWIKKGKAREALFFEDVVSKNEILK